MLQHPFYPFRFFFLMLRVLLLLFFNMKRIFFHLPVADNWLSFAHLPDNINTGNNY